MSYILPVIYVIVSYTFILIAAYFNSYKDGLWILGILLPFIVGIINLAVVLRAGGKWPRKKLLSCTMIIKYSLIPIYLFGGSLTIAFALEALVPLPGMILNAVPAAVLLVYGYGILLGSAPYAIAYLIRSYIDGVYSKWTMLLLGICQFLFVLDVLSIMKISLEEEHRVKITKAVLVAMFIVILLMVNRVFVSIVTA